jgi:SAM-dependent methyltransferase
MAEFDVGYFDPSVRRVIGPRTFRHRLLAWELGKDLYDGARETGYGGFRYDGRWKKLIPNLVARYGLTEESAVLDVGCKKGFFLHDMKEIFPGIKVRGIENHPYAIDHAMDSVKGDIVLGDFESLPFDDGEFDFIMAFSSIYMLNIKGVVQSLREIQRVGKGKSFITCGAYRSDKERALFEKWTLLGTTMLHVDEWLELFDYAGYTGDYYFTTAGSLNLVEA